MTFFISIEGKNYQVAIVKEVLYLKEIKKPSQVVIPVSENALKWDYCWSLPYLIQMIGVEPE